VIQIQAKSIGLAAQQRPRKGDEKDEEEEEGGKEDEGK
jgi:hypothetical protein